MVLPALPPASPPTSEPIVDPTAAPVPGDVEVAVRSPRAVGLVGLAVVVLLTPEPDPVVVELGLLVVLPPLAVGDALVDDPEPLVVVPLPEVVLELPVVVPLPVEEPPLAVVLEPLVVVVLPPVEGPPPDVVLEPPVVAPSRDEPAVPSVDPLLSLDPLPGESLLASLRAGGATASPLIALVSIENSGRLGGAGRDLASSLRRSSRRASLAARRASASAVSRADSVSGLSVLT